MDPNRWNASERIAWTRRDGYTPPPTPGRGLALGATACALGAVWVGLLSTDTLCPEHRMLVDVLGITSLVAAVVAVVGLVNRQWWAPLVTLFSTSLGISVGLVVTAHRPTAGGLTTLAFGLVAVFLGLAAVPQVRSVLWLHRARKELVVAPAEQAVAAAEPAAPSAHGPAPATPAHSAEPASHAAPTTR